MVLVVMFVGMVTSINYPPLPIAIKSRSLVSYNIEINSDSVDSNI
jgi:hypothetical protein